MKKNERTPNRTQTQAQKKKKSHLRALDAQQLAQVTGGDGDSAATTAADDSTTRSDTIIIGHIPANHDRAN